MSVISVVTLSRANRCVYIYIYISDQRLILQILQKIKVSRSARADNKTRMGIEWPIVFFFFSFTTTRTWPALKSLLFVQMEIVLFDLHLSIETYTKLHSLVNASLETSIFATIVEEIWGQPQQPISKRIYIHIYIYIYRVENSESISLRDRERNRLIRERESEISRVRRPGGLYT